MEARAGGGGSEGPCSASLSALNSWEVLGPATENGPILSTAGRAGPPEFLNPTNGLYKSPRSVISLKSHECPPAFPNCILTALFLGLTSVLYTILAVDVDRVHAKHLQNSCDFFLKSQDLREILH